MAKSKSGGTRSFLRGRIGADVYSIGRDGKGKRQQVVRSLAEQVANPQTKAQMQGRMYMSTIMQALSAMSVIVDHSFDNAAPGQPNLSEFIRRNYALVKADAEAHPAQGNSFGLNKYQEKGIKPGAYVVSYGAAELPSSLRLPATGVATLTISGASVTMATLKNSFGLTADEYVTFVGFLADKSFGYVRLRVNPAITDDTALTTDNVASAFLIEGNITAQITLQGKVISITTGLSVSNAMIVSRLLNGNYKHNEAQLSVPTATEFTSDVALPTYPRGSQRFLNGGDAYGESETPAEGEELPNGDGNNQGQEDDDAPNG